LDDAALELLREPAVLRNVIAVHFDVPLRKLARVTT
jgi:hypothetical protein